MLRKRNKTNKQKIFSKQELTRLNGVEFIAQNRQKEIKPQTNFTVPAALEIVPV